MWRGVKIGLGIVAGLIGGYEAAMIASHLMARRGIISDRPTSIQAARFNRADNANDASMEDMIHAMIEHVREGDITHMMVCFSREADGKLTTAYKQAGNLNSYGVAGLLEDVKAMVLGR